MHIWQQFQKCLCWYCRTLSALHIWPLQCSSFFCAKVLQLSQAAWACEWTDFLSPLINSQLDWDLDFDLATPGHQHCCFKTFLWSSGFMLGEKQIIAYVLHRQYRDFPVFSHIYFILYHHKPFTVCCGEESPQYGGITAIFCTSDNLGVL